MNTLGAFHSTYYDRKAFQFAFENFRLHFPKSPYLIYSDDGDDFSKYVDQNTYFLKSEIRYWGTGPNSIWYDNWVLWESYYKRLKDSCEICQTDYMIIMEDDVLITKPFLIEEKFDLSGPCQARLSNHTINFLSKKSIQLKNNFYGLSGGAIFRVQPFLENYDKILENLKNYHYEYTNQLQDLIAMSPDGNFTIHFNLLGLQYECSNWLTNGTIIHPFKKYYQ